MKAHSNDLFQHAITGLAEKGQFALSLYFQHQLMMEHFRNSQEMQKLKQEIIAEVLSRISVSITNTVKTELDKLFNQYNI